ncbi:hypothetical protein FGB62_416g01 [Gracilaria domingensis]|nr:hypothetical protein FGB62_416g01 [Gracilaria domingensis]
MTVVAMRRSAPEVLQHIMAYVRQMTFKEARDYDYLLLLCDNNRGPKEVQTLLNAQEKEQLGADTYESIIGSKRKQSYLDDVGAPVVKEHEVVLPK